MTTLREQQLKDEIVRLRALLEDKSRAGRDDLVEVVFNNVYMGERPGQRGVLIPMVMPRSPDLEVGKHYWIPLQDAGQPWFKRV